MGMGLMGPRHQSAIASAFSILALIATSSTAFAPCNSVAHVKGAEHCGAPSLFSTAVKAEIASTKNARVRKISNTKKSTPKSKNKKSKSKTKNKRNIIVRRPKKSSTKTVKRTRKLISAQGRYKPMNDLKLGQEVHGVVVDVCDFGVFVSIGYATRGSRSGAALLHISQIQNEKLSAGDLKAKYKVGSTIEGARVIKVDHKKGEVGLTLRPRRQKRRDYRNLKTGEVLDGRIESVVSYGAFVDVGASINALLHISRITGGAIENVRHHVNEGDKVSVHVIDIDAEKKTLAVSMLDAKADIYLDRRMSQRLKRYYGTSVSVKRKVKQEKADVSDLDYFSQAIMELEDALKDSRTSES